MLPEDPPSSWPLPHLPDVGVRPWQLTILKNNLRQFFQMPRPDTLCSFARDARSAKSLNDGQTGQEICPIMFLGLFFATAIVFFTKLIKNKISNAAQNAENYSPFAKLFHFYLRLNLYIVTG